jgi:catechol 2,3-dioxygenase-like lactoylglutathione lyase family enzyme
MALRLLPLVFAAAILSAADFSIDHVTVGGASVKDMQARLSALGIATVYGGPHKNQTTEMALVSFPDGSYLEVIGVQPNATPAAIDRHEWSSFLKTAGVPCAWALRSKDLAADVKRLQSAGLAVTPPVAAGRERPDGVRLEWETANLGGDARGTFFPFLIQDRTPREQRAFPQGKPVTRDFKGVAKVVIAVRNLDAAVKMYRKAFGLPDPIRQVDKTFDAHLALLGDGSVVLAQPIGRDSWLAGRLERFGEGPSAFVLAAVRGKYPTASETQWFGTRISWFDPEKLGWHLGLEAAR